MMELNDNTRLKDLSIYLRKEFCIGIYRVGNKNLPPQNTHIFKIEGNSRLIKKKIGLLVSVRTQQLGKLNFC
jgi:hypothetical protein